MTRVLRDPVRLIPLLFAGLIAVGTVVLMLPISSAEGRFTDPVTALFHATSAVAVTGLVTVDTGTYWSAFGQGTILLLIQIGGLGIMTAATLLGLMAGRGFSLRSKMATRVERDRLNLSDTASLLRLIFRITLTVELTVAAILALRFAIGWDMAPLTALWQGVFHSVSAFNNAGFSTFSDSVMGFQGDALILMPIALAVVISALGFPVMEDWREHRLDTRRWTLHSKMTLAGTALLLVGGFVATLATEWSNPDTLGPMPLATKALNAFFHAVMPRTAGFNSLDVSAFRDETLVVNYVLMFIGGGSAGTAGGIKVTTFMVLAAIVLAEVLRRRDAGMFGRRFGHAVERQALTVAFIAMMLIVGATMYIMSVTGIRLADVLFEVISAFATVGLSTGITASLPDTALLVLTVLMFVGRVGTITAATALALGGSDRPYRYPEENPIVG
ncbi:TrkH family potassium uptake protein [Erythrobacter arachoides]|uniref:TrkH family potassium uptake protein n=1 Tax=Aurantiacibacter arachoides TaxID=1850444 RepID=A0A845A084_9SPHN|nr:potassium transporter TrkG [Aurantiacibacter arachoides]MXO93941.1 TrkH family potassium uptake protein [Aurantiacibacter arachoides]GGD45449.1 potassium transporter Trk [Aurantiacibacter arachoides]